MMYFSAEIPEQDYPELVSLWEASVRATHHFLKESDIAFYKSLILGGYLQEVALCCMRNESGRMMGFSGTAEGKLEMLFVHPDYRNEGVGKKLLLHAIENQGVNLVDVNEDNVEAAGFYAHFGFKTIGRSALDGAGNPYPILHMELQ
ncbi:GNAT family N-acetyltransferase [Pedobacter nutrimenti]|uniref:Putative acetyltransferase n=1 Tax=Pedobacter nutrimenti TaxID=1241337 RepID=A0A318UHM7_9SPHI|nr:GNAT family N-acetyltransferase [Pedobacter nutrimenti]PYF75643.1 putative acetyltransferase [Pedobacter nutrimenti]